MLAMVFRRKWIILTIFLATLAMGVSASLKTTSEYQAVAKVLIRRMESSSLQRIKSTTFGLEEEMNTEIEILRSAAVMERALSYIEAELAELPDEEKALRFPPLTEDEVYSLPTPRGIQESIMAAPIEKSNVITIRFRRQNAATARMLTDAVARAYVIERISVRRNPMLESFFHDRTSGLRDRLLDLRTELGQLQIEAGVYDEEWQQRLNLGSLGELRSELLRLRVQRETLEGRLGTIRRRLDENPDLLVPLLEFDERRPFQEIRTQLIYKRTELAELRGRYLPDHPKVLQAEQMVVLVAQDLREEIETQIVMREGEVEAMRSHEVALENAIRGMIQEMNRIPHYAPMIRQIEREINNTAELFELVGTKMVDTQISETEDQRMVNAKVLGPATVSLSFVQQRRSLFALFAAMLGLSLGLALAFLLEGLDHTMRSPDDVEINLGVPLLGSIPELKPAVRR
jgi:uncharacterized protein involved in exopolysaccharide biosynthesis